MVHPLLLPTLAYIPNSITTFQNDSGANSFLRMRACEDSLHLDKIEQIGDVQNRYLSYEAEQKSQRKQIIGPFLGQHH